MDGQARSVVAAQRRCGPRSPSITRAHQEREAPLRHHIKTRLISVRPDAPLATWSGHGEALDAYCRGLFLSAANMLGARSEAPWYTLVERCKANSLVVRWATPSMLIRPHKS
jgi:hypothetical protein